MATETTTPTGRAIQFVGYAVGVGLAIWGIASFGYWNGQWDTEQKFEDEGPEWVQQVVDISKRGLRASITVDGLTSQYTAVIFDPATSSTHRFTHERADWAIEYALQGVATENARRVETPRATDW